MDQWTRATEARQTSKQWRDGVALAEAAAREVSDA
jgi:hypothetical protein